MRKIVYIVLCPVAIVILALMPSCHKQGGAMDNVQYYLPAEYELHEGTWLAWPHGYEYGRDYPAVLDSTWVAMTRALVKSENVHIVVYDSNEQERVEDLLRVSGISLGKVDFYQVKTNDVWARDVFPVFVRDDQDRLCMEDWGFNGWGGRFGYDKDNVVPGVLAQMLKMPYIDLNSTMVLEGGAIEVDGNGTLMATRSSILNTNRNPGLTQEQAEEILSRYLGVTNFLWLEGGSPEGDVTDMHIDGFARFVEGNTIVTMSYGDLLEWGLSDPDINLLYSARNKDGQEYRFVTLPLTKKHVITEYGEDLGYRGSYVNFYIANKVVLVPVYDDPNDSVAISILQDLFPTRKVLGIDVRNLYKEGGMIHCVTREQPL